MNFKIETPKNRKKNINTFLRFKKISLFLSFIMIFSAFAYPKAHTQNDISFDVENETIIRVLDRIESQTPLRFIFGSEIYDFEKTITLTVEKASLNEVIYLIFENKLSYELNENVVILSKTINQSEEIIKQVSPELNQDEVVEIIVTGNVIDNNGYPLPGASVIELGTSNGTTTDFDGNFSIKVNDVNSILEISYVGFITQQVMADATNPISVMMQTDVSSLDNVVLVGYGKQNRRDITSSISVLDLEGTAEKANTNVGQLLQSRSAGVRVVQGTGKPGASPTVFIRGISSLSGNTQPLYVIDGVVSYNTSALDPNNIQDITVLKDASAAGIYGAAGASNGVVLITTKKGKPGNFKVNLNTYTGFAKVINKIPLLNNTQLVDYFTDLNPDLTFSDELLSTNNDWQDLIYDNAQQSGVNLSVSGGGENGSFFVGLGVLDQEGIVVTSKNKRYSLSINLDQKINDWLSFGTHFNYTRSNVKGIPDDQGAKFGGAISSALQTPSFQPIYDENGFYTVSAGGGFGLENPLSYIYSDDNLDVISNIVADANFSVKLPYNLTFKTQLGITLNNNRFTRFRDPTVSSIVNAYGGEGQLDNGERARYIIDNTLSYNETFDKHKLGVVVGNSVSEENIITSSQIKRDFASESVNTFNTASVDLLNTSYAGSWSLQSYFARANYTYDDKYSITTSIRTDGSSRIASDNRWGTFSTFSAGWNISNESFMEDVDFVKNLKLRAGYGETGNLPSGLNDYANILGVFDYASDDGVVSPGVIPSSQRGNNDLQWETSEQFNVGLDFSLLDNSVYVSADYYNKKTNNMIFPLALPVSSGFSTQIVNLDGYIENTGFEFAIDAYLIDEADFSWNSSFNISFNDNVVMDIPENATIFTTFLQNLGGNLNITRNGLPIGSFWGYNSEGVDPQTGDLIYTDNDGVAGITPEDKQVIGNPMPDFTYGFVNEFSYKNWDLNIVIDGVAGNEIYNTGKQNLQAMRFFENQSADIVRRWRNPGDITDVPRATLVDENGNADINSRWVEDGSFLRIRDISLSYNFEKNVLDALNVSGLRIYANLKNWFTFTDYSGYSPEVNRALAGVDQTATTQGVDYGTFPQAKTFSVGLNVEF
jgi:TonB-linked SusC/RagA family outer membrane protein